MATKKGNRRQERARQLAHARRAAEAARQRRVRQRRLSIAGVVAVIAAVGVVAILAVGSGGDGTDLSSSGTSTTGVDPANLESAAGLPCKPLADPLPAGSPPVPVKAGPPPTALVKEDLKPGTGAVVSAGQKLKVSYTGVSCSTGKIFDSSYTTGQPAELSLSGGVIPGWQEGIPGMKVGGQRLLGIPPELGYGDEGGGGDIAPGETLWFVVEVLAAT